MAALSAPFSSTAYSGLQRLRVQHHHHNHCFIRQRQHFSRSSCSLLPVSKIQSLDSRSSHSINSLSEDDEIEACELVSGVELDIGEDDESVRAYFFKAVKNNNGIGLLLLSDIFGFQDSATRDFAYRVACNGYNVLVPDMFHGDPWSRDRPTNTFEEWISRHDPETVADNTRACAKWLADEFTAAGTSNKLGVIGFCYGGGRIIDILANDHNSWFATGVSFYGTRLDAKSADDINVPVLFVVGDRDPLCDIKDLYEMEKRIGNGSKVAVFEGRGHGFAHRPESHEEDGDAEEAFSIMRNWLHDKLDVNK